MRISVICPVHNASPEHLVAAVRSALEQDDDGVYEILLIDDASDAEATGKALRELASERRVTLLRQPRITGPAAARTRGLEAAAGDWFAFLDADDLWPSGKLWRARQVLAERPDASWIIGDTAELRSEGEIVPLSKFPAWAGKSQASRPELTRAIISDGLHLGACLLRRSTAELAGGFDPAVQYGEDLLFLARLSTFTHAEYAPGPGYILRRQTASMMWSARRLTDHFASGPRAGMRDPLLREFRREYRWALHSVYKDMAVNNLVNGRRSPALRAAIQAWLLDPRELGELLRFTALIPLRDRSECMMRARRYSRCEQVLLRPDGSFDRVA